jgi:hypothetical protein
MSLWGVPIFGLRHRHTTATAYVHSSEQARTFFPQFLIFEVIYFLSKNFYFEDHSGAWLWQMSLWGVPVICLHHRHTTETNTLLQASKNFFPQILILQIIHHLPKNFIFEYRCVASHWQMSLQGVPIFFSHQYDVDCWYTHTTSKQAKTYFRKF